MTYIKKANYISSENFVLHYVLAMFDQGSDYKWLILGPNCPFHESNANQNYFWAIWINL